MALYTWRQTFKRNGVTLKNADVYIYLAGTETAARVFDVNSTLQDSAPQIVTDSAGYAEFTLDSDDFASGQLFDIECHPWGTCSTEDVMKLPSLMVLQDTEGYRNFKNVFAQTSAPTEGMREDDLWFDTDDNNHPYRYSSGAWTSTRDTGTTAAVTAGRGVNSCHYRYSTFEEPKLPPVTSANGTVTLDASQYYFGSHSLCIAATAADAYCYFGRSNTDYNIPITPNKKWIWSAYVRSSENSGAGQFILKTSDASVYTDDFTADAVAGTWSRVSGTIDLSANNSTACILRFDNEEGNATSLWVDGVMLEEQTGDLTTPSPYALPSWACGSDIAYQSLTDSTSFNMIPDPNFSKTTSVTCQEFWGYTAGGAWWDATAGYNGSPGFYLDHGAARTSYSKLQGQNKYHAAITSDPFYVRFRVYVHADVPDAARFGLVVDEWNKSKGYLTSSTTPTVLGSGVTKGAWNTITANYIVGNANTTYITFKLYASSDLTDGYLVFDDILATRSIDGNEVRASAIDWSSHISGATKPDDNADVTSDQFSNPLATVDTGGLRGYNGLSSGYVINHGFIDTSITTGIASPNTGVEVDNSGIRCWYSGSLTGYFLSDGSFGGTVLSGDSLDCYGNINMQVSGDIYFYDGASLRGALSNVGGGLDIDGRTAIYFSPNGSLELILTTSALSPNIDDGLDLGNSSYRFGTLYIHDIIRTYTVASGTLTLYDASTHVLVGAFHYGFS